MRTTLYLNGKKVSKKAVAELIGEERLKRILKDAEETYLEDPLIQNDFFLGADGMLTVKIGGSHAQER